MFMINYINYIVRVRARKITKFVAYLPCLCTEDNTAFEPDTVGKCRPFTVCLKILKLFIKTSVPT